MSLLLLLRSPAASVNLSAVGGTATAQLAPGTSVFPSASLYPGSTVGTAQASAAGGTDTLAWTLTATNGQGTGGGGTVLATLQGALLAVDGAATATGGTDTLRYTYTAAGGQATAAGGQTNLPGLLGARGKFVLTDAKIKVAGQDISRFCHTVQVQLEREEIDVTPLGATYKEFMPGPTTGTFTIGLMHDPTVHTPAFWNSLAGTASLEIAPRNFPPAPDNPTWTTTVQAVRRTMLQGQAGDRAEAGLELHSTTDVLQLTS